MNNYAEQLTNAIKTTDTSNFPGTWSVDVRDDGDVLLVWTCDEKDLPKDMYGDEPWSTWGGNEIIKTASIGDYNYHKSGGGSYQDRYGDNMVTQWVCF